MPKHLVSTARAAAFVGLVAFALTACGGDDFARKYAALRAEALARASYRFGPGRPAGVPWSPPRSPLTGAPAAAREAAAPPNGVTRGPRSVVGAPIEHADLGLTQLVDRGLGATVDQVVEDFELAFPEGQGDPTFLNDFATALLERARPRDLILGGEYAARARNAAEEDDPDGDLARAARFNWALALERLALHGQATAAWQAVLERESDPSWRAEAETHAADLAQWPVARWPKERQRLRQAAARGDLATVAALLPEFRTAARLMAEDEELKAWAEHIERDPPKAREALAVARTIGQVLDADLEKRDAFLADVVASIDAAAGDVKKTQELAAAMRGFFGGLEAYKEFDYEAAPLLLDSAAERLRSLGCPAAYRAELLELVSSVQRGLGPLLDWSDGLLERIPPVYRVLRAQARYQRGTVLLRASQPEASLGDLRRAAEELAELGEVDLGAAYRSNLGDALSHAFRSEEAVRESARWLAEGVRVVSPYYRYFVAGAADRLASGAGETRLAIARECLALLSSYPRPSLVAEAQASLLKAFGQLGRFSEAARVRREAEATLELLSDPGDRSRSLADLDRAEASFEPRRAQRLALLISANTGYGGALEAVAEPSQARGEQLVLQQVAVLTEIAQLRLGLADYEQASGDSERAFALLSRRLAATGGNRVALAGQVRPLVDTWLLAGLSDPAANATDDSLMAWAERGHHLSAPGEWSEPLNAQGVLDEVSAGMTLVELVPLKDRLLVLAASREGLARWWLEVQGLERLVSCLDPRNTVGCESLWDEGARRFARQAIEPWLCTLPAGERLVLVAGSVARVPFAALPIQCGSAPESRLVERHVSSLAPSATFWAEARARAAELAASGSPARALALGVRFARGFEERDLARAEEEARAVAAAYSRGSSLLGARATQAAIQGAAVEADVLHIATHGMLDKNDPNGSYLALAEDRLQVKELAKEAGTLPRTRLAVLSACDTGGSIAGIEGLVGVSRAFLEIGVPTVIATLGLVKDEISPDLMLSFHRSYQNTGDAALALAEAQRVAAAQAGSVKNRESNESENERTGPPEWAKWVVVGG